jgi:C1A family cysteine protease
MPVLNYFKDREDDRDYNYKAEKGKPRTTPRKRLKFGGVVDYRKHLSPVKNQGNLGSCVGFAVTALKEFQENVEYLMEQQEGSDYVREESTYDLSEQWTYWNAKKIDPWGPSVEGTSLRYALKVLHKLGCPPEKGWKYTDNKIDIGKPESWAHMIARWNTIDSYWRLGSLNQILQALRGVGPIVAGIGCYEEIFSPDKDGFVSYPAQPEYCYGGHAILICGYNIKTERVLFKNSWGPNWGKDGYGWLGFDYMRDFCWDAWAAKDVRVTRAMLKGSVNLIK